MTGNSVPSFTSNEPDCPRIDTNPSSGIAIRDQDGCESGVGYCDLYRSVNSNKAGVGYTIIATSSGLTSIDTSPFTITRLTPTKLVPRPAIRPAGVVYGASFGLMVTAEDSGGNTGSSRTPCQMSPRSQSTTTRAAERCRGQRRLPASAGIATFTGLSVDKAGVGYTILALRPVGWASTDTTAFTITAGSATQLIYTVPPPSTVTVGLIFNPVVAAEDGNGNTDPTFVSNIVVALAANPGSATLGGTLTHAAVAGVASFTGLSINVIDTGYTIQATSGGLSSVTSGAIAVVAAPSGGGTIGPVAGAGGNIIYGM